MLLLPLAKTLLIVSDSILKMVRPTFNLRSLIGCMVHSHIASIFHYIPTKKSNRVKSQLRDGIAKTVDHKITELSAKKIDFFQCFLACRFSMLTPKLFQVHMFLISDHIKSVNVALTLWHLQYMLCVAYPRLQQPHLHMCKQRYSEYCRLAFPSHELFARNCGGCLVSDKHLFGLYSNHFEVVQAQVNLYISICGDMILNAHLR